MDWEHFERAHWARAPFVFKASLAPLPVLERALHGAAEAHAQKKTHRLATSGLHAGPRRIDDRIDLLIRPAERLEDYTSRASEPFSWIVQNIHHYDFELWRALVRFLEIPLERFGLLGGFVECTLFSGKYESTPFGIHRDPMHVFLWNAIGRKRMLLWPQDAIPSPSERHRPGLREQAQVVELGPGDVLYWPPSHWHVADTMGSFGASISLGTGYVKPPSEQLAEIIADASFREAKAHEQELSFELKQPGLPTELLALTNAFATALSRDRLETLARTWWLRKRSATGFDAVPPPRASVQNPSETFLVTAPILVDDAPGDTLLLATLGHALSVPHQPVLRSVLSELKPGTHVQRSSLLSALEAPGVTRLGAEKIVASLERFRALEPVP